MFPMLFCSISVHFSEIQLVCGRRTDGRTNGQTHPLIEMHLKTHLKTKEKAKVGFFIPLRARLARPGDDSSRSAEVRCSNWFHIETDGDCTCNSRWHHHHHHHHRHGRPQIDGACDIEDIRCDDSATVLDDI